LHARLRGFAIKTLERRGALVEWPANADEGWAMCEPGLAATLNGAELMRLSHRPESGGLCLNLTTDFLDRMMPLVAAEARVGLFTIPEMYLKKSAMDEPVSRAFTWQNAKVKIKGTSAIRVEYHIWSFLAELHSEDTWEDLVQVTLNARTGAELNFPDALELDGMQPYVPVVSSIPDTARPATRLACGQVERRAAEFIVRLESRRERDRKRLRDYYNALLKETGHRDESSAGETQAQDKHRAVELELRRKLAELDERYALQARLTPLTWLRLELPVLAVTCDVFRKQARREHIVFWNPVLTALEPLCCSTCGAGIFSVSFSNNDVLPLCDSCVCEQAGG